MHKYTETAPYVIFCLSWHQLYKVSYDPKILNRKLQKQTIWHIKCIDYMCVMQQKLELDCPILAGMGNALLPTGTLCVHCLLVSHFVTGFTRVMISKYLWLNKHFRKLYNGPKCKSPWQVRCVPEKPRSSHIRWKVRHSWLIKRRPKLLKINKKHKKKLPESRARATLFIKLWEKIRLC